MTCLASLVGDLPAQLGHIFYFIVLPILLLAGVGFALQRLAKLDMATLRKLNFYLVIPALVFTVVVTSEIRAADAGWAVATALLLMATMSGVALLAAWLRRVPREHRRALMMTALFYNSGNYGLPLQTLAFSSRGLSGFASSLQAVVMITQNVTNFTYGILLASGGRKDRQWRQNLLHIVRFPPIYALAAGVLTVQLRNYIGDAPALEQALAPLWWVIVKVKSAFLAVALVTLGAQLATVRRGDVRYPVSLSVMLRLLVGPALALGIISLLPIRTLVAQVLLISSSTPTAVNAMLLCLEFDNHPAYAARAVFYSTLLSPITVTLVIFLSTSGLLPGFSQQTDGAAPATQPRDPNTMTRQTTVSIEGDAFHINGRPAYPGQTYNGMKVEGLLMNARLVQGIFDDLNPATRSRWAYPDGPWDAERNTREFLAAMPDWRRHGLISFTINLQGGSPTGYAREQPWHNSAYEADGSLRPDYMARLERILDRADELGMAVIVGYFYFGQDERLTDEAAVLAAADNATDWLLAKGYTNVVVEIANEVDVPKYEHPILTASRVHELVERVRERSAGRLLASASMGGGSIPPGNLVAAADFLLLHGNGVREPDRIRKMVDQCRAMAEYRGQPILFNEDDHFDFDKPDNNMLAAVSRYAGWGYFDYRLSGEGYDEGFQSVPVNWQIISARKRGFFGLLASMTGAKSTE